MPIGVRNLILIKGVGDGKLGARNVHEPFSIVTANTSVPPERAEHDHMATGVTVDVAAAVLFAPNEIINIGSEAPSAPLVLNRDSPLISGHVSSTIFSHQPEAINDTVRQVGNLTKTINSLGGMNYTNWSDDTNYVELTGPLSKYLLTAMSFSAWVYLPAAPGGFDTITAHQTSGNTDRRWYWGISAAQNLAFGFSDGGVSQFNTNFAGTVPTGRMVHVAMTFDQPDLIGYIDGIGQTPVTFNHDPDATPTAQPRIGDTPVEASLEFDGSIFELSIWNRALTANEVWSLYEPQTRWSLYNRRS